MAETEAAAVPGEEVRETEARLLQRLREGAPEAIREMCDRFGPRLHAFAAAHLLGDSRLAEEVMVEALADGARNIRHFNSRKSTLSAWLYGITRRKVQAELRRQRRRKSVPAAAQVSMESAGDIPAGNDMATSAAARLDAEGQVAAVRGVLSPLEYEALVLNCVDELSAREIGRILGRSDRAIHSLLHRARRKARERLTQDED